MEGKSTNSILAIANKKSSTNSILSIGKSSSTITSNRSIPAKRESLTYVAGNLINVEKLMQNAPKPQEEQRPKPTQASIQQKEAQLLDEVESLLKKRSSHEMQAKNEWFSEYEKRMDKMAKQEYASSKAAKETESIIINGFCCKTCENTLSEQLSNVCHTRVHDVHPVRIVKRFFICNNCEQRDSTLTQLEIYQRTKLHLPPQKRCRCGAMNWQVCGARGRAVLEVSAADVKSSRPKPVAAAAEWTDRKDSLRIAMAVESLNSAADR
jgi:hypothetical protein